MHFDPSSLLFLLAGPAGGPHKALITTAILLIVSAPLFKTAYMYVCHFLSKKTSYSIEAYLNTHPVSGTEFIDVCDTAAATFFAVSRLNTAAFNTMRSALWIRALEEFEHISKFLPINNPDGLALTDDITLYINLDSRESGESIVRKKPDNEREGTISRRTLRITLTTPKSMSHLKKYLEDAAHEYEQFKIAAESELHIAYPGVSEKNDDRVYRFETTKSFDNLFFSGKEQVIKRLDTFADKELYTRMGIPHTLGFMFHGEPGTGKTSAIKAIAQYTRRSLVVIPMAQIRTRAELENIFRWKRIQFTTIPNDKRIYVFEEIDCGGWKDIVAPRSGATACGSVAAGGATSVAAGAAEPALPQQQTIVISNGTNQERPPPKEEKLTLGAILEVLDGLFEASGRIVIMTTNHPQNLDPALRRPGRIDMEVEFKRLSRADVAAIFERWYGEPADPDTLPDDKYTQAELSQLLFRYPKDPAAFILAICSQSLMPTVLLLD